MFDSCRPGHISLALIHTMIIYTQAYSLMCSTNYIYRWSFLTFTATNTGSNGQMTSEITDKVHYGC